MKSFNFWLIWLLLTVFLAYLAGRKRRFVTRRMSGKVIVVTRLKIRTMKIAVAVATAVFAVMVMMESLRGLLQAIKDSLPADTSSEWAIILLPIAVVIVVYFYHCLLCLVFNEANKANERRIKKEIVRRMAEEL